MNKKFHNYIVYDDGKVFSLYRRIFLKPFKNKFGYLVYSLVINGKAKKYPAHRLVALCFLNNPNDYLCVNHIDGNKLNNYYLNLEWCTYYHNNKHARDNNLNNISKSNSERWKNTTFRKNTSLHISEGLRKNEVSKGEKNPRFKYRIYCCDKLIDRHQLSILLGFSISYTDFLIRKSAEGKYCEVFKKNNIKVINTKAS